MGCFLLLLTLISPRLAMVAIWLITDWEDRAFSGWLLPLLGIVFLPWTTLLYTIGYIVSDDQAAPWGILGIIIGLFLDIAVHAGSAVQGRRRYST
ncbi:MAG TPA: hypothetical protein VIC07_07955 [Acidimicrobiia bacterium]|jgi:hypothetical protein